MTLRATRPVTQKYARRAKTVMRRAYNGGGKKRGGGGRGLFSWRKLRWVFALFVVVTIYFVWDMPDSDDVKPLEAKPSITVLAHDGTVLARYGGIKGDVVDVRDLPPHVVAAVLAIEDRRFYSHFGIDPIGLARAMFVNARAGGWVQGGSTITQQLAKNLFLTPDKTIRRKVQEALLALSIDFRFSKDDILSAYLNRVYFGGGAYGIDAAARVYFNKPSAKLTLWESAVLAGVLKAPSRYSPNANPEKSADRAKVVITAMQDSGFLDEKKALKELKNAKVTTAGSEAGDLRRYFTDWVIDEVEDYVGTTNRDITVRTTFDADFQIKAEQRLEEIMASLSDKKKAKKGDKPAPDENLPQAAIVTLSEDGAVLAMIGGRDYAESQFNRATQALRQPGSAFKSFVYLAALELGYDPEQTIEDAPMTEGSYRPSNHDGKYYGQVTLTDALALSLNTATIRMLQVVGMPAFMDVMSRLPFPQKFRPELATGLGAGETTLLDLTAAYAVIANGGYRVTPYAVLSIKDDDGRTLYRREKLGMPRVFSGAHLAKLDDMLVQVVARGTAQNAQLGRGHVAGKTGTSQNYRDAWFVGYTDNLVTGVWMGNDDSTPTARLSGGGVPARCGGLIWVMPSGWACLIL